MDRKTTDIALDEFLKFFEPADQESIRRAADQYREYKPIFEAAFDWGRVSTPCFLVALLLLSASGAYAYYYPECGVFSLEPGTTACRPEWTKWLVVCCAVAAFGSLIAIDFINRRSVKGRASNILGGATWDFLHYGAIGFAIEPDKEPPERVYLREDKLEELQQAGGIS